MSWVSPRTWVAGNVLTAAQMNVDVRDNTTFLAGLIDTTTGNLAADATSGPHAIGGTAQSQVQLTLAGSFTSSGAGSSGMIVRLASALTLANGDTVAGGLFTAGASEGASITTQGNSETIANVQTLDLSEPGITVGSGDTVTNAQTLLVRNAPTEGSNNDAIRVLAGSVTLNADNQKLIFGAGRDASIYYDGTNLVIDPAEVGSGGVDFNGCDVAVDSQKRIYFDGLAGDTWIASGVSGGFDFSSTAQGIIADLDWIGGAAGFFQLRAGDNGASVGARVRCNRNTNSSTPAAGHVTLEDKGATLYYVWPDDTGDLRIHTSAPTNANDGAGTVVGDQSSWHELKTDIAPWDGAGALDAVCNLPLHAFRFVEDGRRADKLMHGLVVHESDREAWWVMNGADNQVPCLDEANLIGHLIAAVKELSARIEELEAS